VTHRWGGAGAVAMCLALLTGCGGTASQTLPGPVPAGVEYRAAPSDAPDAPDGELELLNGDRVSLDDLARDRPVVLLFFEAWCGECADRQDDLDAAADRYGDAVTLVSVAAESTRDEASDYADEHDVHTLVARDPTGDLSRSYAVDQAPFTVFVAPGGSLVRGWPGYLDDLDGAIDGLLVERMPDAD